MNANERVDWILGSEPNWCEVGAYKWETLQRRIFESFRRYEEIKTEIIKSL